MFKSNWQLQWYFYDTCHDFCYSTLENMLENFNIWILMEQSYGSLFEMWPILSDFPKYLSIQWLDWYIFNITMHVLHHKTKILIAPSSINRQGLTLKAMGRTRQNFERPMCHLTFCLLTYKWCVAHRLLMGCICAEYKADPSNSLGATERTKFQTTRVTLTFDRLAISTFVRRGRKHSMR